MTSGGGAFSAEEVAYLKTLPAVADVTAKRITYTEAFKLDCVQRYAQGESPVRMFREAGLEPALIGYKRIECAIARWRRTMGVPTTKVTRSHVRAQPFDGVSALAAQRADPSFGQSAAQPGAARGDMRDLLIYQQVRRIDELERQVDELSTQLERAESEISDMESHMPDAPVPAAA